MLCENIFENNLFRHSKLCLFNKPDVYVYATRNYYLFFLSHKIQGNAEPVRFHSEREKKI
jgi:hypothetical protein